MGTSPMGVLQLLDSTQVTLKKKTSWLYRKYHLETEQGGLLKIKGKGSNSYHVIDCHGQQIAELQLHTPWFKPTTMRVKLTRCPAVTIRPKGPVSRSTLIMDENDQPALRIKHTRSFWCGKEYKILGRDNIEVGSVRKDWSEYDLLYPLDLDVRYKLGLIANIIYNDIIEESNTSSSS